MKSIADSTVLKLKYLGRLLAGNLFFLAILLMVLFANLLIFNKYFPVVEGWWESYAYLMNSGLIPYRDFNLNLPILIPVIFQYLLKITDGNFYLLRLIGVAIYALIFYLLYKWLLLISDKRAAVAAAGFAIFLDMSGAAFIAKDYHSFVHLAELSSLICITSYLKTIELKRSLLYLFFTLIFSAILFLIKQNVGLIFFSGILVTIGLKNSFQLPRTLYHVLFASIVFIGTSFSILQIFDVDYHQLLASIFDNDAKGSVFTVLTRAITNEFNLQVLLNSFFWIAVLWLLTIELFKKDFLNNAIFKRNLISKLLIIFSFYVLFNINFDVAVISSKIIIPLSIAALYFIAIVEISENHALQLYKKDHNHLFILMAVIAYSNTTTASFNYSGMLCPIAFSLIVIYDILRVRINNLKWIFYLLPLCLVTSIIFNKYKTPYAWWGYQVASIGDSTYQLPYKQMEGIFGDRETFDLFNSIKHFVENESLAKTDVYFYPSIPIFYMLHNKLPPYKNMIQWFDVVTTNQMNQELLDLKKSPPRLIVYLKPVGYAFDGHFQLKKQGLSQAKFDNLFTDLLDSKEYDLIGVKVLTGTEETHPNKSFAFSVDVVSKRIANVLVTSRQLFKSTSFGEALLVQRSRYLAGGQSVYNFEYLGLQEFEKAIMELGIQNFDQFTVLYVLKKK